MHLPDPKIGEMGRLEQVIKGSKCEYAKLKPGTRERLPITPELLLKMRKIWKKQSKSFDNIMLWESEVEAYSVPDEVVDHDITSLECYFTPMVGS